MKTLTSSRLRKLLDYDPDTGVFVWRVRRNQHALAGNVAGCTAPDGYVRIRIDGKLYLTHRLAWLYTHGRFPPEQLDHRNGVRDDNRIANLRKATNQENARNQQQSCTNTSGRTGVTWNQHKNKWQAQINIDGKTKYLGYFTEFADACEARAAAEREQGFHGYHGLEQNQREICALFSEPF